MVSPLHMQACKRAQKHVTIEAAGAQLVASSISNQYADTVLTTVQYEVNSANASSISETSSLSITLASAETSDVSTEINIADSAKTLTNTQTELTRVHTALATALRQLDNKKAQLAEGWIYVRDLKRRLDLAKATLIAANSELEVVEANEIEAEEKIAAAKHRADRYKDRVAEMQVQLSMSDLELENAHAYCTGLKFDLRDARKALKVAAVELEGEKALRQSSNALLVVSRARAEALELHLQAALARSAKLEARLGGEM
jgi:chromosome segregation ATPase